MLKPVFTFYHLKLQEVDLNATRLAGDARNLFFFVFFMVFFLPAGLGAQKQGLLCAEGFCKRCESP